MPDPSAATLRPCMWRFLDVWCFRRMDDAWHGSEGSTETRTGHARQEMPLTKAAIRCTWLTPGRQEADVLCPRVNGLSCPYALGPPDYKSTIRKLFVRGLKVLEFHRDAENQIAILEAFQAAGWPRRIENIFRRPLPCDDVRHRLSDAVRELNRRQNPQRIHFWVERGTQAVLWEFTDRPVGGKRRHVAPPHGS